MTPSVPAFLARTTGPRGGEGRFVQGNYLGHLSNFGEDGPAARGRWFIDGDTDTPVTPTDTQLYLRISELHYNPVGTGRYHRIRRTDQHQRRGQRHKRSIWPVSPFSGGPAEAFQFAAGTSLAVGSKFLVLARDPAALAAAYPELARRSDLGSVCWGLEQQWRNHSLG